MDEMNQNKNTVKYSTPIILDLGTQSRQQVSDLKRGKGDLMTEVMDVIDEVSDQLSSSNPNAIYIPIIVVYGTMK
ncbi:MAG UNVERIFIED_CONTAM: hypothetical protein LVQ98_04645 [Rickettsiaceae bacterium]|jgi:hypothetical protein